MRHVKGTPGQGLAFLGWSGNSSNVHRDGNSSNLHIGVQFIEKHTKREIYGTQKHRKSRAVKNMIIICVFVFVFCYFLANIGLGWK
jgi:hypothetical protein